MDLSQAIGSKITIPMHDLELRREVEARGFFPHSGTPQELVMRRQLSDGVLVTTPHFPPFWTFGLARPQHLA